MLPFLTSSLAAVIFCHIRTITYADEGARHAVVCWSGRYTAWRRQSTADTASTTTIRHDVISVSWLAQSVLSVRCSAILFVCRRQLLPGTASERRATNSGGSSSRSSSSSGRGGGAIALISLCTTRAGSQQRSAAAESSALCSPAGADPARRRLRLLRGRDL